jgi:hypothetical protein
MEIKTNVNETGNNANVAESKKETKTYTQEEVEALLQAEGDRRVSQALKKKEQELSEAAKLQAMNEKEKQAYEIEKMKKDLEEREKLVALNENKFVAMQVLSDKKLPTDLADLVVADTAETTKANIATLEKAINNMVADEVKKKIGVTINTGNVPSGAMSKEAFFKMSLSEQQAFAKSNPDIYRQFIK